jgi:hypothetical protein
MIPLTSEFMNRNDDAVRCLSANRWSEAIALMQLGWREAKEDLECLRIAARSSSVSQGEVVSTLSFPLVCQLVIHPVQVPGTNGELEPRACAQVFSFASDSSGIGNWDPISRSFWSSLFVDAAAPALLYNMAFAYHMLSVTTNQIHFLNKALQMYNFAATIIGAGAPSYVTLAGSSPFVTGDCSPQDPHQIINMSIEANKAHLICHFLSRDRDFHSAAA